ncbi:hypothetical protein KI387_015265, partial [Taxus chinensis]
MAEVEVDSLLQEEVEIQVEDAAAVLQIKVEEDTTMISHMVIIIQPVIDKTSHMFSFIIAKITDTTLLTIVLNLMAKKLLDLPPSEEMGDIYKAFDDFVGAVLSFPLNIPGTTYARGIRARGILLKRNHKCIKERREHPEVLRNDLLTKLVREGTFSDEIIADTIIFFVFAGVETSAMAMTFAVKYLTENPRALKELRVKNETLRLGGATVVLFREAKQDIKVKDFVIPKGWTVYVFLSATHVDGKYHYEAEKFLPWRWQNKEISGEPCYMPFGRGGRLCPGLHLARFEIALFLHNFVTKFRWEQLEIDRATYFPLPSTENGFPIRLYSR